MPAKKAETKKVEESPKAPKKPLIHRINEVLATIFYVLWIAIGLFVALTIYSQIRQGVLSSMMAPASQAPQVSAPAETNLPGVGTVNISCVQQALDSATIQKLVQAGDASTLTADEKAKLAPCITAAESPAPSTSPAPKK